MESKTNNDGVDKYKLYYFPVRNLGEPIRMMLNYAGQPFEDVRISLDEWQQKWKHSQLLAFDKIF